MCFSLFKNWTLKPVSDVTPKKQTNTLLCPFGDRIWKVKLSLLVEGGQTAWLLASHSKVLPRRSS